jgi:hypothetical protein
MGRIIAVQAYLKKTEASQISSLMIPLKHVQKQEQTEPKLSRRKEIIMIRVKINEINTKTLKQNVNKRKNWTFEEINNIDKPLANLTRRRREKTQINKIKNGKGYITTNTFEIQVFLGNI